MKKRTLLKIIISLLVIFAGATWWLNTIFLPTKVKAFLAEALEQQIGRSVSLEDISYNIFKGIILKELTIFEKGNHNTEVLNENLRAKEEFLKVKEVTFTFPIFPLLRKKVIIPILHLNHANVTLIRKKVDDWNFSDILAYTKQRPLRHKRFSIVVYKVIIHNGEISFEDLSRRPKFLSRLNNLDCEVHLSIPSSLKFRMNCGLLNRATTIATHGQYLFATKTLNLRLSSEAVALTDYATYYQGFLPLQVAGGMGDLTVDLLIKDKLVQLSGASSIENIDLRRDSISSSGDLSITTDITYDLVKRASPSYKGDLILKSVEVAGAPFVRTISDINGNIRFCEGRVWSEKLKGITLGSPIIARGSIQDLEDLRLDLSIESEIELAKLKTSLPAQFAPWAKETEISGVSSLTMNLSGSLKKPLHLNYSGRATLLQARLKGPWLAKELEDIDGTITFGVGQLSSSDLSFKYRDFIYKLAGSLLDFDQPKVELALSSQDLSMKGSFQLLDEEVKISKAEGNYSNSSFDLRGAVGNLKDPTLDLYGDLRVDLLDLRRVMPGIAKNLTDIALEGRCDLEGVIRGKLKEPLGWEVELKVGSRRVSVKDFKFEKAFCDFRMSDGRLSVIRLVAYPYEGRLTSSFACQLTRPSSPFVVDLEVAGLNLARLAKDTPLIKKDIWGRLFGKLRLEGSIQDPGTFRGNGWVRIEEANLWEIQLLGQLADLLYFTALPTARLKEASGTFVVTKKNVITRDLELRGDEVTLLVDGSVGFDTQLNLYLTARVAEKLAAKLPDKVSTFFKRVVWGGLARYRIEGTLAQPKFSRAGVDEILIDELKGLFKKLLK